MYVDNYSVGYVTTENSVYATSNQPVNNNEEENGAFQGILADTINETAPTAQAQNNNTAIAMDSVPPVIKTQGTAEPSYVSKYYPIPEDEVVSKIVEVRHIINNENMATKTDIEKYDFIENKFIDAFGKDFMIARDLNLPTSMFYMIGVEFNSTLGKHIENPEQTNRIRLHGNASTENIQEKIRESYPPELTNRDLFNMVGQMRSEGVLDTATVRSPNAGSKPVMDTLAFLKNYARYLTMPKNNRHQVLSMQERDASWASMLDKPVNTYDLPRTYNVWVERGRVAVGADAAPFMVKFMGEELGADGKFILPGDPICDIEWEGLMNMMFGEFAEHNQLVRDRMNEIDAAYNASLGVGVITTAAVETEETLEVAEDSEAGESGVEETTAAAEGEAKAA